MCQSLVKTHGFGFVLSSRRNYRSFATVNTGRDDTERCFFKEFLGFQ